MKDYQTPSDAKNETDSSSPGLSESGQRAMQGYDVVPNDASNDDMEALERRVEQLRNETESREAAERANFEQQKQEAEPPSEKTEKADSDSAQSSPEAPLEHDPQSAINDAGDAERAETGPEKTEAKTLHGMEGSQEKEGYRVGREGRLR